MNRFNIEKLISVNKNKAMSEKFKEIKEFLESQKVIDDLSKAFGRKINKLTILTQGSYSRHTASYSLKNEKSDIDILVYIGDYYTSNSIQKQKNNNDIYTKNMSEKIKLKLNWNIIEKSDLFVDLLHFINIKKRLAIILKNKFNAIVKNNNKSISMEFNNVDIDIVIAGRWNLNLLNDENYNGSNVIIDTWPFEVQNLPELNKENIELKAKRTISLYEHIRLFKNISKILELKISSFHLECILYNVPDSYFKKSLSCDSVRSIISYIRYKFLNVNKMPEILENNEVLIINNKINKNDLIECFNKINKFVEENVIWEAKNE